MSKRNWILILSIFIADISQGANVNEYYITETGQPSSLDPLDADQTQNLPVARMIYATPLEIDASDSIQSLVLEKFDYDKATKTISWMVKKGLKFANGQDISAEDVAFAVARMAFKRPKFPVIELIEGVAEWATQPNALKSYPSGLKVSGQMVTIKLLEDHAHPLFRFCLELFSIIPKSCVNAETNAVTCEKIPESGRYSISKRDAERITFEKRISSTDGPTNIQFEYMPSVQFAKNLDKISSDAVVAGNESLFSGADLQKFAKSASFYYLPASRFAAVQINPATTIFSDKLCRQVFAREFRRQYNEISKDFLPGESSIFTKILPGYMSPKDMEAREFSRIKPTEIESCFKKLRAKDLSWGYVNGDAETLFVKTMEKVIALMELKGPAQVFDSRKEMMDAFVGARIAVVNAGSGFWANDPAGDLQMLFTPNLHRPLNYITKDENLQKLIRDLGKHQADNSKFYAVNQYLHDEALINTYTHLRRFYFSKNGKKLQQIPQGSAAPHPWQVFK